MQLHDLKKAATSCVQLSQQCRKEWCETILDQKQHQSLGIYQKDIYKSNSVNSDPVDEPSTTKMYEHVLSFVPRFQTVKLSEIMNLSLQFASSDIRPSLQIAAGDWCFRE